MKSCFEVGYKLYDEYFQIKGSKEEFSSGISEFPIFEMYKKYFLEELNNSKALSKYTVRVGYPPLVDSIRFYEKIIACKKINISETYANHMSLTMGGSAALGQLFKYFKDNFPNECILMIGMNYWLFYEICSNLKINYVNVISHNKGKIIPDIDEVICSIKKIKPKMVLISLPMNPSGEMYTEEELSLLIRFLKEQNILLCIDKCQSDEFNKKENYLNEGFLIEKEGFISNAIVINSLSKIRGMPGLRLGYIIANEDIISYFIKYNSMFLPSPNFSYPIIIDYLLRIVAYYKEILHMPEFNIKVVLRMFKMFVRKNDVFNDLNYMFSDVLDTSTILDIYYQFNSELTTMWDDVYYNYSKTLEVLKDHITDYTILNGGFNFLFKVKNHNNESQFDYCKKLLNEISLLLLPEDCFKSGVPKIQKEFSIRATLSVPRDVFNMRLYKLKDYLNK